MRDASGSFSARSALLRGRACVMAIALALGLFALPLCGCAVSGGDASPGSSPRVVYLSDSAGSDRVSGVAVSGSTGSSSSSAGSSSDASDALSAQPLAYPTGWLAVPADGIPAGQPIAILSLPDIAVSVHSGGRALSASEQQRVSAGWPATQPGQALVEYEGARVAVSADALLVNLPDLIPSATYDIVYSYASTSRCAGQDIAGVTGQRLPGYAEGMQPNAYWARDCFAVPCAYRTALKAMQVEDALERQGLRLLVFDAYRPVSAQYYLSDAFQAAFFEDPVMQASLGAWSLDWYVASGPSGHNYGTDLDAGVCDDTGAPLPMPSDFDAFDETGHLTDAPIDDGSITPGIYRAAVAENEACLALHQAFTDAGFSELASEWWHFGDGETEAAMRALVGPEGLDFTATSR